MSFALLAPYDATWPWVQIGIIESKLASVKVVGNEQMTMLITTAPQVNHGQENTGRQESVWREGPEGSPSLPDFAGGSIYSDGVLMDLDNESWVYNDFPFEGQTLDQRFKRVACQCGRCRHERDPSKRRKGAARRFKKVVYVLLRTPPKGARRMETWQ